MISRSHLWQKLSGTKWQWILAGFVLLLLAMRVYYVEELLAALVIFSLLFAVLSMVLLIVFVLDRAGEQTIAWAELGAGRVAHWMVEAFEVLIASPVWPHGAPHRWRREPLKPNPKN